MDCQLQLLVFAAFLLVSLPLLQATTAGNDVSTLPAQVKPSTKGGIDFTVTIVRGFIRNRFSVNTGETFENVLKRFSKQQNITDAKFHKKYRFFFQGRPLETHEVVGDWIDNNKQILVLRRNKWCQSLWDRRRCLTKTIAHVSFITLYGVLLRNYLMDRFPLLYGNRTLLNAELINAENDLLNFFRNTTTTTAAPKDEDEDKEEEEEDEGEGFLDYFGRTFQYFFIMTGLLVLIGLCFLFFELWFQKRKDVDELSKESKEEVSAAVTPTSSRPREQKPQGQMNQQQLAQQGAQKSTLASSLPQGSQISSTPRNSASSVAKELLAKAYRKMKVTFSKP